VSFEPENPLEEALVRSDKNPMARREFRLLFLESDIVVIGRVEGREFSDEDGPLRPGEKLKLGLIEYKGLRCVPCFTSTTRLAAGIEQHTAYVTLKGRALFQLARGVPVMLNIGSELGKGFSPDEIDEILNLNSYFG
jgi:SseB protein N-terminal domain